jgi:alpha-D-xyloside xylohydrolase
MGDSGDDSTGRLARVLVLGTFLLFPAGQHAAQAATAPPKLDGLFYEMASGRRALPDDALARATKKRREQIAMPDGRVVTVSVKPGRNKTEIEFSAKPNQDIVRWGAAIEARADEHFTGLMERVVDGPQQDSWAPNITAAMDLRGQKVDMIVKPTTSVYAPFYISSRGYAVFVRGTWPGRFDFCAADPQRVQIQFEGPSLAMTVYAAAEPVDSVKAHALDAGSPFLPPKWMYGVWRWRDEHTQRPHYYDGTPVTGPFNSEMMEDVLLMKAYGIPLGVYWIDRPWGPGRLGYDDFEIDAQRLPNFEASVKWLNQRGAQMSLWIGPFFQGRMETEAQSKGWTLAGQRPSQNNYPLCDFTNPDAKKYWQNGVAKLLKMGVAAFKLDRSEEDIPDDGPAKVFDGRTLREQRNDYPVMYVQAAHEVAREHRADFVCMPRAAYTGSSRYGVFWGGDIGGTQEGLRAEIIAVQRAAVMGYPNWGSDTCGYSQQTMDTEVCGRWLAFSAFTPIMEVGPTNNRAFWDFHEQPTYDAELIALWRLYGRLHTRLIDYSFAQGQLAHETGMPIVRPLFLADPEAAAAWSNWWTYLYGPDILVSPIWKKGQRTQDVYLPAREKWRDAWNPDKVHDGGQTIQVNAEPHQIPIFVRVGSKLDLGDLNREWSEARDAAATRPDLKALDADVREWFERFKQAH